VIHAVPYESSAAEAWDELVSRAPMATFLHSRRFLAYHGDRFEDASLVIQDRDTEQLLGVLPAAVDPDNRRRVASHPGATFGGIIHDGALSGERMLEGLAAVRKAYAEREFIDFTYKAVPWIYHQAPSADDVYALFRLGAARNRVDLSSAIDLAQRRTPSSRRRRGRKKAQASGLEIDDSAELIPQIWRLVEENLERRYGARPVHTLDEILQIRDLFPEHVRFVSGAVDGEVVAGIVLFLSPSVAHVQYNAANDTGREIGALDGVFEHCIEEAAASGKRFWDFGISTESDGRELNEGLYRFKSEFGGGGVAYEFYELAL
jgi:hypothetical protein